MMNEIRCKKCNRLLFKVHEDCTGIEIKCPKCSYLNQFILSSNLVESNELLKQMESKPFCVRKGLISEGDYWKIRTKRKI